VSAVAQDARTVVEDASGAMGAAGLNTIVCSGVGAHAIYPDSVFLSVGSSFW
jgi:NAD/NADP transhydrogenase alpha subunit